MIIVCVALVASAAAAKERASDARVTALIAAIEAGGGDRAALAAELAEVAPRAAERIAQALERPRSSTDEERRAVLAAIRAAVPDDKGRFRTPARQKQEQIRADDDFDWVGALAAADSTMPGYGEVYADIAIIRALAASGDVAAGVAMLQLAFDEEGIIYRDEVGRWLRKMAPYSIPALIRGSESKRGSMRRYATYQLERLDREQPFKALEAAAEDEQLQVAILEAYRESGHREAVHAVLAYSNHNSPLVRKAARRAWIHYVAGPAPPPAPKRKLELPGGRLSDEEQPLWLTYRELADIELHRVYEETFGEAAPKKAALEELSNTLFDHYDREREKVRQDEVDAAFAQAEAGELGAATAVFDRILAENPDHGRRADMAPHYLAHAKQLEDAGTWREASAAYSKAAGLAPDESLAETALAGHHFTLGMALEASGADGSAELRAAGEIAPEQRSPEAIAEARRELDSSGRRWMLYAGLGGGVGALFLLGLGLALRRRA